MSYNKHERLPEAYADESIDFVVDNVPGIFFGLHLSQELSNYITNLFDNRTTNIESMAATSGGAFFYGHNYSEKKITIKSFYYIDDVLDGALNDIYNFYNSGYKRKLYFTDYPWIEYEAVVSKISHELYSKVAGVVSIEMTIVKGYGIFRNPNLSSGDILYNRFIDNTGYIKNVPVSEYGEIEKTISSQTEFYIYNPGNRKARTVIEITGSAADGLTINNAENGNSLKTRAFDTSTFTSPYTKLVLDSESGKTYLIDNTGTATTNGFKYHKAGAMSIEPSNKIDCGDITSATKSGSTYTIITNKKVYGAEGKCFVFYISGDLFFCKINSAVISTTGTTFTCQSLSGDFTPTTMADAKIVDVNKIIITPVSTASCNVKIKFTPTF